MYSKFLFIVLVANLIEKSLTCNGYKTKLVQYENCGGPDQIITIEDGFQIKLNKNCELIPEGCIKYKGFESAIGNIRVFKDNIKLKDSQVNICEAATKINADGKQWMKLFAIPENCPIQEGKVCTKGQAVNIGKFKNMLSLIRGNLIINSTIQHDNNGISCFVMNLDITK